MGPAAAKRRRQPAQLADADRLREADLVIVTGMSGSGKGSVLKAFEDLGYYCVDNLPVDLIPKFAELYRSSPGTSRAALVVDIREGAALQRFPAIYRRLRQQMQVRTTLIFLLSSDEALLRRFSETRRPHPLGSNLPLRETIAAERKALQVIRNAANLVIDTSQFNVHDLRNLIFDHFSSAADQRTLLISCVSFGYRHGVPTDSDLVFDVRFLPNPNYIPKFQPLSGKHPAVAKYIRSFPQTEEFTKRISELLTYLIPHYSREGKNYLTISFGCTGGRHRSVMMAETIAKTLSGRGFRTKVLHRDVGK
ncbi:MAG: RNase adaptor protein RapZ [Acidobacteria bacterium RIFCSPLOWO2_12_FULL_59_11]|nr:MAG: RNase adaptor protein RapZ [Acidobacteria bacterium RIFCSPLOWO2_12_FULL_59_11]